MGQTGSRTLSTAETPSSSAAAIVGSPPPDGNVCENVNEGQSIGCEESSLPNIVRRKSSVDFDDTRVVSFMQSIGLVSAENPCKCLQDHQQTGTSIPPPSKRSAIQSLLNHLDMTTNTTASPKKTDRKLPAIREEDHPNPETGDVQAMYEAVGKTLATRLSESARQKVVLKLKEILDESHLDEEPPADDVRRAASSDSVQHQEAKGSETGEPFAIKKTDDDVISEAAAVKDDMGPTTTTERSEGDSKPGAAEESSSKTSPELADEDMDEHYIIQAIKNYLGIGTKKLSDENTEKQTIEENAQQDPDAANMSQSMNEPEDVNADLHTVKTLKHIARESLNQLGVSAEHEISTQMSEHSAKEERGAAEMAEKQEQINEEAQQTQAIAGIAGSETEMNLIDLTGEVSNIEQAEQNMDINNEIAGRSEEVAEPGETIVQDAAEQTEPAEHISMDEQVQIVSEEVHANELPDEVNDSDETADLSVQTDEQPPHLINEITEPDSTGAVGWEVVNEESTEEVQTSEKAVGSVHLNEPVQRSEHECVPMQRHDTGMQDAADPEQTDIIQTIKNFFGLGKKKQRKRKVRKQMADSGAQTDETPSDEHANEADETAAEMTAQQSASNRRADRPKLRLHLPTGDGCRTKFPSPNTTYLRSPSNYPTNTLHITPVLRVNHRGNLIDAIHSPKTPYERTPTTAQPSSPWLWTPHGKNTANDNEYVRSPVVRNIAGTPQHGFTWSRKSDADPTEHAKDVNGQAREDGVPPLSLALSPDPTNASGNFLHPSECEALQKSSSQQTIKMSPSSAPKPKSPRRTLKALSSPNVVQPADLSQIDHIFSLTDSSPMLRRKSPRNAATPSPHGTQKTSKGSAVDVSPYEKRVKMIGTRKGLDKRRGSPYSRHGIEQASVNVKLLRD